MLLAVVIENFATHFFLPTFLLLVQVVVLMLLLLLLPLLDAVVDVNFLSFMSAGQWRVIYYFAKKHIFYDFFRKKEKGPFHLFPELFSNDSRNGKNLE